MLYRNGKLKSKSKLFRTIGGLSVAGMVLAGVAAVAFTVSSPQPTHANSITPPPVPPGLEVDPGNKVFLLGHGVGTQNYVCRPSGTGVKYVLFTPQATLFSEDGGQVITHFFSPNPFEPNTDPSVVAPGGTIRVTWQHRDSSIVWAKVKNSAVVTDAVALLLLEKVGVQAGPTGGDVLTKTTFIQRLNTTGGLAPSTGCASLTDVGKEAFIPYTADYFFYMKAD